nr:ATP-binding protein [Sulfobacillus harzensis]
MEAILAEVAQHTAMKHAAIYRLTRDRRDSLRLYAVHGQLTLSERPVPAMFLEADRGLVGEALWLNVPRYSGDDGSGGYLIPGVRQARVAVFPLRYQERPWGILLWQSDQSGWFATYRDLLEVLAQEIAIAAASAEAADAARRHHLMEERARMQSEILANVSHELRTPLGLVKGYLETLERAGDRLLAEERSEFLQVAVQETRELEALIEQLLTMSTLDSTGIPFQPQWFSLESWLNQLLDRFPVWERSRIRAVGFEQENLRGYGDAKALITAVSDLVQNALKYSEGAVEVAYGASETGWRVSVRDFGPGVPTADMDKIFERFYRSPVHAQSEIRGSGLGLSIVKRIAEAHGGTVHAENMPDPKGFRVAILLPWALTGVKEGEHGRERLSIGH